MHARPLYWCLKIGQRKNSIHFYTSVLGMQVLRNEEFATGCPVGCNGPYSNKWSETMIGYGPEATNFVLNLTYNYPIKKYTIGNDLVHITIKSDKAIDGIQKFKWPHEVKGEFLVVTDPDGYKFLISKGNNILDQITLNVSNLDTALKFWVNFLEMKTVKKDQKSAVVSYGKDPCKLELIGVQGKIDHKTGFGRIALSVPLEELHNLNISAQKGGHRIQHQLQDLEVPGKAIFKGVVLLDPDGYEACFFDDENYSKLCLEDPQAPKLLAKSMDEDQSDALYDTFFGGKTAI